jgi:hypothetical protein
VNGRWWTEKIEHTDDSRHQMEHGRTSNKMVTYVKRNITAVEQNRTVIGRNDNEHQKERNFRQTEWNSR